MNIKEVLEIVNEYIGRLNIGYEILLTEDQLTFFNIIKQDLEVLEIIKKHLTICGLSISCFIGGNPNVKETYEPKFNNLKEWLDE